MGTIKFEGEPPFALPEGQSAVAGVEADQTRKLVILTLVVHAGAHSFSVRAPLEPLATDLLVSQLIEKSAEVRRH